MRYFAWTLSVVVAGAGPAYGQKYPSKPIRIVTAGPGAGQDIASRLIAQSLAESLGQPVIVDNRAGITGAELVSRAPPDGYTLLLNSDSVWIGPLLQKMPYDPVRDFAPLSLVGRQPSVLIVHPSLPVRSVTDLIALAKRKPGELNYASSGTGTSAHLAAELFKSMAGVDIVRIAFKNSVPALNAVISGDVHLTFVTASLVVPHLGSGRLRALGVASIEPSALTPGLPTIAAMGLPGFEYGQTSGAFAPAATPAAVMVVLNQEIVRTLRRTEVREKLFHVGVEAATSSPEQFAAIIKTSMTRMAKLITDAGIKAE